MEPKGANLLYTLAGVMTTFAGFSALLLSVRPAAGAKLSQLDRFLAKTVMTHVFVLTAGALMPVVLALFDLQEYWIWRASALLFALPLIALQVTFPFRRKKATGQGPPFPIYAVFVVLGAVVTSAMLVYVLGGLPNSAAVYIAALTVDFFTVVFSFLVALEVILQQPME
jgi:hypothetical protein